MSVKILFALNVAQASLILINSRNENMTELVIIGTGLAGYTLAREFRRRDQQTSLLLITSDDGSYYSKPVLSNALSKGKLPDELILASAEKMAEDLNAEIWTHCQVTTISADAKLLQTTRGEVSYERLVLANGANTISAPIQGTARGQVLSVNDLEGYRQFRNKVNTGSRIVIIGAGMIGCEFANDLSNIQASISMVDMAVRPLGHLLPAQVADKLQEKLTTFNVAWYLGNSVTDVDFCDSSLLVTLKDGTEIMADTVLSAIGLRPNLKLAITAELDVDRGIKVDRYLRTSDKNIFALGDCVQIEDLTLPFVMPLMTSARALAASLAGDDTAVKYPAMPVALKTPCYPTVVCPVPRPTDGLWEIEDTEGGMRALFKDNNQNIMGFVLTNELISEKASLTKQVADWLS